MSFLKKIVHGAINPFVDRGPFGAGPSFSTDNPRSLSRGLFELSRKTWTPPSAMFNGPLGAAVAAIGERFPVLAVGDGSNLDARDQHLCDQLLKAAARFVITRDPDEPVVRSFGELSNVAFDRIAFLRQLQDSTLVDVSKAISDKVAAANIVAKSGLTEATLSVNQWTALCANPGDFRYLGVDEFENALAEIDDQQNAPAPSTRESGPRP